MKGKKRYWVLFLLCLAIFLTLRLRSIDSKPERSKLPNLYVPTPLIVKADPFSLLPLPRDHEKAREHFPHLLAHPWIQTQPSVKELSLEMVRDIELLEEVCEYIYNENPPSTLSKDQITEALMQTAKKLQDKVPFSFPEELYNVLCIPQTTPFKIYQRLYLGETKLGIPFYLDIRVFELENSSADEVIASLLNTLVEGEEAFNTIHCQEGRIIYKGEGKRRVDLSSSTHGFAEIQGKRGIYLDCIEKEKQLFVAYAETPLDTFKEYEWLFEQLKKN